MDGRSDMLRELCDESDGYVTTDMLSKLIDDPCMLKTALTTLDAENTGRIPFQKVSRATHSFNLNFYKKKFFWSFLQLFLCVQDVSMNCIFFL